MAEGRRSRARVPTTVEDDHSSRGEGGGASRSSGSPRNRSASAKKAAAAAATADNHNEVAEPVPRAPRGRAPSGDQRTSKKARASKKAAARETAGRARTQRHQRSPSASDGENEHSDAPNDAPGDNQERAPDEAQHTATEPADAPRSTLTGEGALQAASRVTHLPAAAPATAPTALAAAAPPASVSAPAPTAVQAQPPTGPATAPTAPSAAAAAPSVAPAPTHTQAQGAATPTMVPPAWGQAPIDPQRDYRYWEYQAKVVTEAARALPLFRLTSVQLFPRFRRTVEYALEGRLRLAPHCRGADMQFSILTSWLSREGHCQPIVTAWEDLRDNEGRYWPPPYKYTERDIERLWNALQGKVALHRLQPHEVMARYQGPIPDSAFADFITYLHDFKEAQFLIMGDVTGQEGVSGATKSFIMFTLCHHIKQNKLAWNHIRELLRGREDHLDYDDQDLMLAIGKRLQELAPKPAQPATALPATAKPAPPPTPALALQAVPSTGSAGEPWCHFHKVPGHDTNRCNEVKKILNQVKSGALVPAAKPAAAGGNHKRPHGPGNKGGQGKKGRRGYDHRSGGNGGNYANGGNKANGSKDGQQGQNRDNDSAPRQGN